MIASWPRRKVERLRQTLSGVYARAILAGSLEGGLAVVRRTRNEFRRDVEGEDVR